MYQEVQRDDDELRCLEGERQQEVQRDGLYGLQWLRALPGWIIIILSCQL